MIVLSQKESGNNDNYSDVGDDGSSGDDDNNDENDDEVTKTKIEKRGPNYGVH